MYHYYEEEQTEMAEAVLRGLQQLDEANPLEAWQRLTQVGLPLLAVPEENGGLASGPRTFHAVAEALGRSLQATPLATSALVATRLVEQLAAEPLRTDLLQSLAAGEAILGLAWSEVDAHFDLAKMQTTAVVTSSGWSVTGRKAVSLHSGQVRQWIVAARTENGDDLLLLIAQDTPGLTVRRYPCLDGSEACDLDLQDVQVDRSRQLGAAGAATSGAVQAALDLAELALCAESAGIQARLLEDTVGYAKERRQFGAAIGSFQAVQHRLVEMLVALEQARSLAWLLATEFDFATPERRSVLASAAKVRCIASSRFVGLQSIHLHGGMGMTDVLPIGRGVKRLLAIENSFGNEAHHLARITRASLATTP